MRYIVKLFAITNIKKWTESEKEILNLNNWQTSTVLKCFLFLRVGFVKCFTFLGMTLGLIVFSDLLAEHRFKNARILIFQHLAKQF